MSHGHGLMALDLCNQLLMHPDINYVILTLNVPERSSILDHEKLRVIHNELPKGFGANHNDAFKLCKTKYFAVLNPDIEIDVAVFSELINCMNISNSKLIAPLVLSKNGQVEDSVRKFPTIYNLIMKAIGHDVSCYPVNTNKQFIYPNWVAGMFMLFDAASFAAVEGFDEGFFLYYEDVDICTRFWGKGFKIAVCQSVSIIHNAQRDSRKKLRYMLWHLSSLIRYFCKHFLRRPVFPM